MVLVEDDRGDAVLMKEIIGGRGLDCEMVWFNDGQRALGHFSGGGRPISWPST